MRVARPYISLDYYSQPRLDLGYIALEDVEAAAKAGVIEPVKPSKATARYNAPQTETCKEEDEDKLAA